MPTGSAFLQIWSDERLRENFLSYVQKDDLKPYRLACKDFAARAAPNLFKEKKVTFRKNVFTSPRWMAMLNRLGHHVQTFHFNMPHSKHTSLPPLIDGMGDDVTFIYDPYTGSSEKQYDFVPPYGSPELYDLLTKHYPTLFHAAANAPSFIRVFASLTNVKHLKVSCPGQDRSEAYMRSAVDYALISLRIAVERNRLLKLDTLSLLSVHPMAPFYLNPLSGFGARPNSVRRWSQVRNLSIYVDTPPTSTPADHLKLLHNYLQVFAPRLEEIDFRWQGMHAPWPLSLHNEPPPQNVRAAVIYSNTIHLGLPPLHMPRLRSSYAENITIDASQISAFVEDHHHMTRLHERCSMDFQKSHLRSGTWDEALAPFSRISGADKWEKAMSKAKKESIERLNKTMDVRTPTDLEPAPELDMLKPVCFDPDSHRVAKTSKLPHLGLHKAGIKTKDIILETEAKTKEILLGTEAKTMELLQGTEDRVKEMFRASIFSCWGRRSPSVVSSRKSNMYLLPSAKFEMSIRRDDYLLPATRYEGSILGRASRCA